MKVKRTFLMVLFFLGLGIINSYAYQIVNRTDMPIYFKQTLGGEVRSTIAPGKMILCKWNRDICNKDGKINSHISFRIEYLKGDQNFFICNANIIAGGTVVVTGNNGRYTCTCYGTGGGH